MHRKTILSLGYGCCCFWTVVNLALAQGTAFTYQGQLNEGGSPANGLYDLSFALFGVENGPAQLGNTLTLTPTAVTDGRFMVTLDFGANFTGGNRWLEIGVRTNGGANFTTLSPRLKLTATPYAITAANVSSGAGLSGNFTGVVTLSNSANQFAGTFTGNGAGVTNLPQVSSVIVARSFGAVGDGIADDTAALQAAIEAANNQTNSPTVGYSPGRTELQLESGLYRTTAPLWIRGKNGLRIVGLGGRGQCMIRNYSTDILIVTNAANAWSQEPNNLTFEGLSFNSTGYATVGIRFCANVNTTDVVEVRDCYFSGFEKAIFMSADGGLGGVSNSRFENLEFFDNHYGIVATNGLFNANRVEGICVGNTGAAFVLDSGGWDISLRDSGGVIGITPTTNILWITGSPKIILRGGQSEYYGAPGAAAILATGQGGYDLLCDGVTLRDFTGGEPWAGQAWAIDLEDSGVFTSYVQLIGCQMGIVNSLYSGSPFVKITHSEIQRVTAFGPQRIVAGYFSGGIFYTNFMLQPDPISIVDNSANIRAAGSIFWGFKIWLATNGIPKLFLNAAAGLVRIDAADTFNAANLTSGTIPDARLAGNIARLNTSQTFAADVTCSTNLTVGGFLRCLPTLAAPANNSTLIPASGCIRLVQSNGAITLNPLVAIADGVGSGAILVLEGTSDSNTVTVPNAAHTRLAGGASRTLGAHDLLILLWNGTDWLELSYSNN